MRISLVHVLVPPEKTVVGGISSVTKRHATLLTEPVRVLLSYFSKHRAQRFLFRLDGSSATSFTGKWCSGRERRDDPCRPALYNYNSTVPTNLITSVNSAHELIVTHTYSHTLAHTHTYYSHQSLHFAPLNSMQVCSFTIIWILVKHLFLVIVQAHMCTCRSHRLLGNPYIMGLFCVKWL